MRSEGEGAGRVDPIRILVLDDHAVVRHGISAMLSDEADMMVVAQADRGESALPLYLQFRPRVSIVDLRLPGMSGARFIKEAKRADGAGSFIVLTTWDSDEEIYEAFNAGADACVLKDSFASEIIDTIRLVSRGARVLPADIASRIEERASSGGLSARERDVIAFVAQGDSNRAIAEKLSIREGTVKTYMIRIFEKLGVSDRTAAVMVAIRRGIIRM